MTSKRSKSLTVIALLLAWLSLGGFAIAVWASVIDTRRAAQTALAILGLWYGISALAAAGGIWRMQRWAVGPLTSWGAATLVAGLLPQFLMFNQPPFWPVIGAAGFVLLVIVPVWIYVRRALRPATEP